MKRASFFLTASLSLAVLTYGQSVTNGNFRAVKSSAVAAAAPRAKAAEKPAPKEKIKTYPYHGYLDSVAPDGSWIRLKGKTKLRELVVSKDTTVSRNGSFVKVADLASGERVTGTVFRNREGREQARTIRIKSRE